MRLVGYTRVSTDIQIERESITTQESIIRSYCRDNNFFLMSVIKDEGVSGTVAFSKRKGGSAVIEMLNRGLIDGVVITKLDRAFRSASDALFTLDSWHKKEVAVFILNFMNGSRLDSRDPMSKAMLSLISVFSQLERDMIALRVRESLATKKEDKRQYCKSVYGFRSIEGVLEPYEPEMEIVTKIFEWRHKGMSLNQICAKLNTDLIPTPRGGYCWYKSTVNGILNNNIYNVTI